MTDFDALNIPPSNTLASDDTMALPLAGLQAAADGLMGLSVRGEAPKHSVYGIPTYDAMVVKHGFDPCASEVLMDILPSFDLMGGAA